MLLFALMWFRRMSDQMSWSESILLLMATFWNGSITLEEAFLRLFSGKSLSLTCRADLEMKSGDCENTSCCLFFMLTWRLINITCFMCNYSGQQCGSCR